MKKKVAIVISICTIFVTVGLGVLAFVFWGGRDDEDGVIANPDSLSYHTDNENQSESAQPEQSQQNNNQDRKTRLTEEENKKIFAERNMVDPVDVPKEITIALKNGEKLYLKYVRNEHRFGSWSYAYSNDLQPNVEYFLNEKGEIKEIENIHVKKEGETEIIFTKQQAMDKSREILRKYIGDSIDDYEIYDRNTQDTQRIYTFTFQKLYGEGDFIIGEQIQISIYRDGDIRECLFPVAMLYEEFDRSIFDKITKAQIEEQVAYAIEKYYKNYRSYEIVDVRIQHRVRAVYATVVVWPEKTDEKSYTSKIEYVYYFL